MLCAWIRQCSQGILTWLKIQWAVGLRFIHVALCVLYVNKNAYETKQPPQQNLYLPGATVSRDTPPPPRYLYLALWGAFQWLKTLAQESARLPFTFGSAAWTDKMTLENGLAVSSSECGHSPGPFNQAAKHPLNDEWVNVYLNKWDIQSTVWNNSSPKDPSSSGKLLYLLTFPFPCL